MAVDKGRNRGAAFLGRDTGALQAGSGCLLLPAAENSSTTPQQTIRVSIQSLCVSVQELRTAVPSLVYGRLEFLVDMGFAEKN
ncbi:hypothetical protein Y032_0304g1915 [Ancylostoma ceylanicum]|uniref:Uncharacterized protein n=1 Tax=Ancylostoma ceylanicum TaxID=53326 RepID=A0A016S3A7_9BILA|nr:hypothetical protein Y032_0304g1915 [Ancylostoma ceylanicum]